MLSPLMLSSLPALMLSPLSHATLALSLMLLALSRA